MTCSLLPRLILKDNQNPNGQSTNGRRWKAFNIIQHWKPIIGKPGQKLEPSRSKIAKSPLVESNGSNMWRGEHVPSEIKEELKWKKKLTDIGFYCLTKHGFHLFHSSLAIPPRSTRTWNSFEIWVGWGWWLGESYNQVSFWGGWWLEESVAPDNLPPSVPQPGNHHSSRF